METNKDYSTPSETSENSQSSDNPPPHDDPGTHKSGDPGSHHSHPGGDRILTNESITLALSKPKSSTHPTKTSTDEDCGKNEPGDVEPHKGGELQTPALEDV